MNKIVREGLASELPAKYRGEIALDHVVRVVVEDLGDSGEELQSAGARVLALEGAAGALDTSIEQAVRRVRDLRDQ